LVTYLPRNCLLKYVIEGKIEGTLRRRRRRKQLLADLKGKEKMLELEKGEALDRTMWRTHFVRGYGPAARQAT
jgi:hypothetical protein